MFIWLNINVNVSILIDLFPIDFFLQSKRYLVLVICFTLLMAGHINLISEVESAECRF